MLYHNDTFLNVFLLMNTDFLRNKDMDKWIWKCKNLCHKVFIVKKKAQSSFPGTPPSYYSISNGANTAKSNCFVSGAKPKRPNAYRRGEKKDIIFIWY